MSKSIKFKNNTYLDISSVACGHYNLKQMMTIFDDTQANDIKELLRKKIEIAKPYLNGSTLTVIVTGGWSGHNYAFTIVNRNHRTRDIFTAVIFFHNSIYICRFYQEEYTYFKVNTEELQ